jgi:nucleotide-binding universal stress UspA family protein
VKTLEPLRFRRIMVPVAEPKPSQKKLAREREADAIVTGSRGGRGFGSMILGSVSQRVVHDATVPVIIVPPHLERAEEVSA